MRLFLAILFALPLSALAAPTGAEALLIVTGDQHSAYDRTAQFVGLVDRLRQENPALPVVVLLDGDTLEYGNVIARRSHGAADFAEFAALAQRGPTVLNLGNHDPEFYDVADTVRRVTATGVKVISNITNRADGRPFASASVVLPLGHEPVVIVGVTTEHLATYRVAVRPSLDLANPVVWAKANFPTLLRQAPLQIVLSHAGLAADREMLPLVPDGTLFSGAHDHLRFIQDFDRTRYFHSGAWNEFATLAWLCRDPHGEPRWVLEQVRIPADGPADPAVAAAVAKAREEFSQPEDRQVLGRLPAALTPPEAARYAARALRDAAGVDAAFIGNTTFGGGLPAGEVNRLAFDACVRFDGTVYVAEVDGARLQALLAAANQGPETPFAQRHGEFNHAAGPERVDPAKRYRIATTDWGMKNSANYFGAPALTWTEQPGLRFKAAVAAALAAEGK
jgi:5'-nucleotidase / UDP-sugar diphosphatase